MKSNDIDTAMARATTATARALDYETIETRARRLRGETLRALAHALVRRVAHAWAGMKHRAGNERSCRHDQCAKLGGCHT
jgi:hypothetical protein